jgi:hypothetical protein
MKFAKICAILLSFVLLAGIMTACNGEDDTDTPDTPPVNNNGTPDPDSNVTPPAAVNELPAGFEGIDFADGNIGFLAMNYFHTDASANAKLELAQFGGSNAVKITPDGTANPYIAIDASSLLGDRITDVASIEVGMAVQHSGGFHAVQGEIFAYYGNSWAERREVKGPWSIFAEIRNPNAVRLELDSDKRMVSGAHNMFIIKRDTDNAIEEILTAARAIDNEGKLLVSNGEELIKEGKEEEDDSKIEEGEALIAQASAKFDEAKAKAAQAGGAAGTLYITYIGFKDDAGNYLPVNSGAGFSEPENFNEASFTIYELPEMNLRNSNFHQGWLTDGVDSKESPYLAEDFSQAVFLVLEFTNNPTGSMQVVWQGNGDGWTWHQTDGVIGEDGIDELEIRIDLSQVLINYDAFKSSTQLKLIIGYEDVDDLGITRAYLMMYE